MNSIIKYNGKNILYFNFKVKIFPGINEIENVVLDGILTHPGFIDRFERGELVLVEDNRNLDKSEKKQVKSEKKILKMIEEIYDVDFLKKIIQDDDRGSVVQAAKARIDHLSYKAEDKEDKNDGHFE